MSTGTRSRGDVGQLVEQVRRPVISGWRHRHSNFCKPRLRAMNGWGTTTGRRCQQSTNRAQHYPRDLGIRPYRCRCEVICCESNPPVSPVRSLTGILTNGLGAACAGDCTHRSCSDRQHHRTIPFHAGPSTSPPDFNTPRPDIPARPRGRPPKSAAKTAPNNSALHKFS